MARNRWARSRRQPLSPPNPRNIVRNFLARVLRVAPPLRGKSRIGRFIQDLTTDYTDPADCQVTFPFRSGAVVQADLRSPTEWATFWTGEYDREAVGWLARKVRPGSVMLDIGANVGYYAAALGPALRTVGGRYHAFEPLPSNLGRLGQFVTTNRLNDTVTVHPFGLGDRDGEFGIQKGLGEIGPTGNAYLTDNTDGQRVTVRRLDDVAAEFGWDRCDLLKVDVEGFEMSVFRGGRRFLEATKPLIVTELHPYWMAARGWGVPDLNNFFMPLGYRLYGLGRTNTDEPRRVTERGDGRSTDTARLTLCGCKTKQIPSRGLVVGEPKCRLAAPPPAPASSD